MITIKEFLKDNYSQGVLITSFCSGLLSFFITPNWMMFLTTILVYSSICLLLNTSRINPRRYLKRNYIHEDMVYDLTLSQKKFMLEAFEIQEKYIKNDKNKISDFKTSLLSVLTILILEFSNNNIEGAKKIIEIMQGGFDAIKAKRNKEGKKNGA